MGRLLTLWIGLLVLGFFTSLEALVRPEVALAGKFALFLTLIIAAVIGVAALFCFISIWFLDGMGPHWTYKSPRWKVAWHLLRTQSSAEPAHMRFSRGLTRIPNNRKVLVTLLIIAGTTFGLQQLNPSTPNPMAGLVEVAPRPWVPGFVAMALFSALLVTALLTLRVAVAKLLSSERRSLIALISIIIGGLVIGAALRSSVLVPTLSLLGLGGLAPHAYTMDTALGAGLYLVGALGFTLFLFAGFKLAHGVQDKVPVLKTRRRLTLPTFIATVGIAVGVWALIVVLSVMEGFGDDLRNKILQVDAHVHVESQQLDRPLPESPELVRELRALKEVQSVHPMVIGRAMITTDLNTSSSVDIKGIDPFTFGENKMMRAIVPPSMLERLSNPERLMPDHVARRALRESEEGTAEDEDSFIAPSRIFPGILLGSELAESLGVRIGDRVQVISPEGDESPFGVRPRTRSFRVAGTFRSGMYQYDLRLAYVSFWDAGSFFRVEEGPNHLEIVAHDKEKIGAIVDLAKKRLNSDTAAVRSWQQMNQALLSALDLERIAMFLVLGFIILVASFNIIGSLFLVIVEKAREIAILRAMGSSGRWVGRVFLNVGAFIGIIGIGTGLLLGLATCFYIKVGGVALPQDYYLERMPVNVDPMTVCLITFIAAVVVLLSTLLPTMKASRLTPTEGLRNE
jgi:ABC-type lipoprotein release transport system permease subunit